MAESGSVLIAGSADSAGTCFTKRTEDAGSSRVRSRDMKKDEDCVCMLSSTNSHMELTALPVPKSDQTSPITTNISTAAKDTVKISETTSYAGKYTGFVQYETSVTGAE